MNLFRNTTIVIFSLTYLNIQSQRTYFEDNWTEKGIALAQSFDASIGFYDELNDTQELRRYIENISFNNPELLANTSTSGDITIADEAYPWLLQNFIPAGFRGAAAAALVAAIVSSLGSMVNSTATIFTMDIYKPFINPKVTDSQLVLTGRVSGFIALCIAVLAAKPLLGDLDQAFQYIQEYTGFTTPAIFAIFIFGLFWKRATPNSVLWAAIAAIPLSTGFKILMPGLPFMNRWVVVFLIMAIIIVTISLLESSEDDPKGIQIDRKLFNTGNAFNIGAIGILAILAILYTVFW